MRWMPCLALAPVACCAAAQAADLSAERLPDRVRVTIDGALFTEYRFAPDQKYPYFYPLYGPASGESVTTESSEPYPHHHSLFFGCDRVNGGNYWQDVNARGQIVSQGAEVLEAAGARVVVADRTHWAIPGRPPVIEDRRRIVVTAPAPALRIVDFTIVLEALEDVTIEKTNHSLFSARMAPALSAANGGTLINAEGLRGEAATFGIASPWMDCSGVRGGAAEGLAILQHPSNPWYPSPWFTRDYGFFSPTPMYWPAGGVTRLPKGKPATLRYRVVVHAGTPAEAGIAAQFAAFAAEP